MRHWLTCLLLIGCGQSAQSGGAAGTSGQGTQADAGHGGTTSMAGGGGGAGGAQGGAGAPAAHGGGSGGTAGRTGSQAGAGGQSAGISTLSLVPNVIAGREQAQTGNANIGSSAFAQRVGTASGTSLMSLKYYVQSIQLCESLDLMGSGYSNPRGCVLLYENQAAGSPDYNHYMVTEALADTTPGRYIDLMSADGQRALRQPRMVQLPQPEPPDPQEADAGVPDVANARAVFRYGLINFYRPIKVTAQFPIIGEPGNYFRTKSVLHTQRMEPTGMFLGSETVEIGDTLSGDTEETTYMLNNGGALFTFQKPFVITQDDVDAQTPIKIDLVFNPENFGQAYDSMCQGTNSPICDTANGVTIDMPFVRMSPVPRKQGEHTHKETYLMDYDGTAKLRIELYYNDADPEAGVQGVDTAIVYGSTAPGMFSGNIIASNFVSQSGSVQSSDASLRLQDYRHMDSLSGLRRRQAGTATVHCIFTGAFCPSTGAEVSKAYTYEGDTVVSAD